MEGSTQEFKIFKRKKIENSVDQINSLNAKRLLQTWFPMEVGLGWTWDEEEQKYVIN